MPFADKMMISALSSVSDGNHLYVALCKNKNMTLKAKSGCLHSSPHPAGKWLCDFGQCALVPMFKEVSKLVHFSDSNLCYSVPS